VLAVLALALACGGPDEPDTSEEAIPAVAAGPEPALAPVEAPAVAAPPTGLALWVLCEGSARVLDDPARIDTLIRHSRALGATDLFVQVYRGGRAWFDSERGDREPYEKLVAGGARDPLRLLIQRAHEAGIRVHAWVNALSLAQHDDGPLLASLGRDAVLVDRRGRSMLDYPDHELPAPDSPWYRMGTPGLYLDPAAPGVREWLVATFVELVTRYPALDGLHLDYIRHPDVLPFAPGSRFGVGMDFGYGAPSRARFQRETGLQGPYRDPKDPDPARLSNSNAWDTWRRNQVSALVAETARASREARPGLLVSAAVIAYADRAYLSLAQDWRRWIEEGWLDFAVPMAYTLDDRLFRYWVQGFAAGPEGDRIWPGLGSWLFAKRPERAAAQLLETRAAGAPGEALFSYDAIAEHPELLEALARVPRTQPVPTPPALPADQDFE